MLESGKGNCLSTGLAELAGRETELLAAILPPFRDSLPVSKAKAEESKAGPGRGADADYLHPEMLTLALPPKELVMETNKVLILLSQSKFGFFPFQPRGLIKSAVGPELGSFSIGRMQVLESYWKIQDRFGQLHDFCRYPSPSFIKTNHKPELEPKSRDNGSLRPNPREPRKTQGLFPLAKTQRVLVNSHHGTTPNT